MRLNKILCIGAFAGLCIVGANGIANAQSTPITSGSAGNFSSTITLSATVSPEAILFLSTTAYATQAGSAGTLTLTVPTQIGATPVALASAADAFPGDGVVNQIAGGGVTAAPTGDQFTPIFVSLFLSTAQSSVTLDVSDTGMNNSAASFTIPAADLVWFTQSSGSGATADIDDDLVGEGGAQVASGVWSDRATTSGTVPGTVGASGSSAATLLTASNSGLYNAEQVYNLYVPYGVPAGTYTDTITYSISAF